MSLAALYVVLYRIFLRAWSGCPGATHAPFWAVWSSYGRVRSRCSSCCRASRWASARRAQRYVLLPLRLLLARRVSALATVGLVTAVCLLAPGSVPPASAPDHGPGPGAPWPPPGRTHRGQGGERDGGTAARCVACRRGARRHPAEQMGARCG